MQPAFSDEQRLTGRSNCPRRGGLCPEHVDEGVDHRVRGSCLPYPIGHGPVEQAGGGPRAVQGGQLFDQTTGSRLSPQVGQRDAPVYQV